MPKFNNETEFVFSNEFVGFTTIPNHILNDKRISFKALGIYAQILQYQNNPEHKIYIKSLVKMKKDGKDSVSAGIKELLELGYLSKEDIRNEKGQIQGVRYTVYMKPCVSIDETESGKSVIGKSETGKLATYKQNKDKNKINKNDNKKQQQQKEVVAVTTTTTTTTTSSSQTITPSTQNIISEEMIKVYKNCFDKKPTKTVQRQIARFLIKFESDAVEMALTMASNKGKEFDYAIGIMNKWQEQGAFTIDAIYEYDKKYESTQYKIHKVD